MEYRFPAPCDGGDSQEAFVYSPTGFAEGLDRVKVADSDRSRRDTREERKSRNTASNVSTNSLEERILDETDANIEKTL